MPELGPVEGFPGLIAPASLKRAGDGVPQVVHALFSGVNCPGLIEAFWTMLRCLTGAAFSGVNCPGLIEAQRVCSDRSPPRTVFRG